MISQIKVNNTPITTISHLRKYPIEQVVSNTIIGLAATNEEIKYSSFTTWLVSIVTMSKALGPTQAEVMAFTALKGLHSLRI
jgi:hypothetical protein